MTDEAPKPEKDSNLVERRKRASRARLGDVADLYLQCVPVHKIATKFNTTVKSIYRDLNNIRKMWAKHALTGAKGIIASELAKLDRIEREAWEMHERQKNDEITDRREKGMTPKGPISKRSKTKQTPKANAAWLQVILDCMEKRAKLLKLYDPDQSHTGVMRAMILEVVVENPEQVQKIISYDQFREMAAQPVIDSTATVVDDGGE